MFSLNSGDKIAAYIIKGDDSRKKAARLFISENKIKIKSTENSEAYCKYCDIFFYSKNELKRHREKSLSCCGEDSKIKNNLISDNGSEFTIFDDSTLFPVYTVLEEQTMRALFMGQSGSGKTTLAKSFIECVRANNRKLERMPVILISRHDSDKSIDDLKNLHRLSIDVDDPIELQDLTNKIIMFDDTENSTDKKWQQYVEKLRIDVFQNGRKYNIHCIAIIHIYESKTCKPLISECNNLILMNQNMSSNNDAIITKKIGLSVKDNNRLKNKLATCGSCRFIYFNLDFPRYIVTSKFAWII